MKSCWLTPPLATNGHDGESEDEIRRGLFFLVYPPQPISHSFTMNPHSSLLVIGYRGRMPRFFAHLPFELLLSPPMSEWGLFNLLVADHIADSCLEYLTEGEASKMKQSEAKWNKVNQGEPKSGPQIHWGWGAGCEEILYEPSPSFHSSSFFQDKSPKSPIPKNPLLIHHVWSQ